MDHLQGLIGVDTSNTSGVTSTTRTYLKYAWDMYRVHLENNLRYDHPPMTSDREWKAIINDSKEKRLRK